MKASFTPGSAIGKAVNLLALIPVIFWVLYPNITLAANNSLQRSGDQALVFEVKNLPAGDTASPATLNTENTDQNVLLTQPLAAMTYNDLLSASIEQEAKQAYKDQLRDYLDKRGSPFAECVDLLVQLPNSDKILSLGNAESGMGKRAPHGKHNYWGVGGSKLWKMGNSVCEGIQSMDNFLVAYPRNSAVKYSEMSITDMCGLYKQPCPGKAKHHWVTNNNVILNDLKNLRSQAQTIAQAKINSAATVATAAADLSLK